LEREPGTNHKSNSPGAATRQAKLSGQGKKICWSSDGGGEGVVKKRTGKKLRLRAEGSRGFCHAFLRPRANREAW